MEVRREEEPVFSKLSMLRFARYITNGNMNEEDIKRNFAYWANGPSDGLDTGKRYAWIQTDDKGHMSFSF